MRTSRHRRAHVIILPRSCARAQDKLLKAGEGAKDAKELGKAIGPSSQSLSSTKGYSSTDLAMGFANVWAGTQKRRAVFGYLPEH